MKSSAARERSPEPGGRRRRWRRGGDKRGCARKSPDRQPAAPRPDAARGSGAERVGAETLFNNLSAAVHRVSARAAGSLRFSIKLRIALAHVLLLGRRVFTAAFIVAIAVAWMHRGMYEARYREGVSAALEMDLDESDPYYSPSPGVEVYVSGADEGLSRLSLPKGWAVEWRRVDNDPRRPELMDIYVSRDFDQYIVRLDARDSAVILAWCGFALAAYWLVMSLAVLHEGQGVSARLLAPITHIANTAEQLSEQNLSMRINVAGTQNELRNLAMMVNGMLDRIESAYNRQKQFVSDASHELRTPIAVLQGYADLLARWGKDAPEVRDESIQAIRNETRSMKELVENLLYLARHDKGTLKLNPEPFSSVELIQEAVRETALIAQGHHIETGGLEDCTLTADRSAIKQALRIFVDNAVKYTPPGGFVSLSCRVENDQCHITVRDTGSGISKQDLPRIFDRFYRADSARNNQSGGHGLGLSIARIIASSHGGKLHVRSKPGSGSAFTIILPAA
ncbi:MAG: HAMP domain-containing histidine kinase [Oscillospiraceae bacterium]|jgi:signal transduction histidine kinase|nr:HAMP domain-containing histidine kinase [Oscillospiraceae bacterium]